MVPRTLRAAAAAAAALALTGCTGQSSPDAPSSPELSVSAIEVAPAVLRLTPGTSAAFTARARSSNGTTIPGVTVAWSSSAPNVATVHDGTVTAIAAGHATITASADGRAASASVTVDNVYDLDARGVPKFISHGYIDLTNIARISRFRSGIGHDYSDGVERCRSMKHYFQPNAGIDWGSIAISAPVSGTVDAVLDETTFGKQLHIVPIEQTAFTVILFHVRPLASVVPGAVIAAGQPLGTHVGTQTMSDIAIRVMSPSGQRFVSYFDAITEALFQAYSVRGVSTRSTMIIGAAERDASALTCLGEQFLSAGVINNWVELH